MFSSDQYQLLDFGNGRKLEKFGTAIVERPCPAANKVRPSLPEGTEDIWRQATAKFTRGTAATGRWSGKSQLPQDWTVRHGRIVFQLKATPFGHLGLFPEQAENWQWIADRVRKSQAALDGQALRVLNLFAYTGGSTLAAAAAGAEVTHVDAAKTVVQWARHNAAASDLADAPIRWIVEDVVTFAERELKRGNQYDAIILDPPAYGHGPKGQSFRIESQLMPLLKLCGQLTRDQRSFFLLTCHSAGFGPAELQAAMSTALWGSCANNPVVKPMTLATTSHRKLAAGYAARWPA